MRLEGRYTLSTEPHGGSHYTGNKWERVLSGRVFRTPLVAFVVREVNRGDLRGGSSVGAIPWIGSVSGIFILRGIAASTVQDDLSKPDPCHNLRNRICNPITIQIGKALGLWQEPIYQWWQRQRNYSPYYRGAYGGYRIPRKD